VTLPLSFDSYFLASYVRFRSSASKSSIAKEPVDSSIGELIRTAEAGDTAAADRLFVELYRELHAIAERERRRGFDMTLGTTTLLHEAYLKISHREGAEFANQAHFMGYAARAMRGLVIDYSRRRGAVKRGGDFHITSLDADLAAAGIDAPESLEALGTALDALGQVSPDLAELVDLHFFCGFNFPEIAKLRGVSERTVQRDWRRARLLLHRTLQDS
jgi:RNA polymerase sigma factor (TIGR02999 family)